MLICPTCQSQQFDGTIFCDGCGGSMGGGDRSLSEALARAAKPACGPLDLVVDASGRRFPLAGSATLLLGRSGTAPGATPDIDLEPEGAKLAGVSRRHALLHYKDGTYLVEDMDSANGTFLNRRRLQAHIAVPLRPGDQLCCASIRLRVEPHPTH